jgi:uncharacterized protein YidB (DUF937 family)
MLDILLGSNSGPLGKLLSGKNSAIILALLPVVLGLLGSSGGGVLGGSKGKSGLDGLLGTLTSGGLGDVVGSWVGGGPNKRITPAQVKKHLGPETVKTIAGQSGLSVNDTAKGLAALLPVVVNELTPKAQVPHPSTLDDALQGLSGLLPKM